MVRWKYQQPSVALLTPTLNPTRRMQRKPNVQPPLKSQIQHYIRVIDLRGQYDQDTAETHARINAGGAHVLVVGVPPRVPLEVRFGEVSDDRYPT